MQLAVSGRVFSGLGEGKYYVGHPEYQKRFEQCLGYVPYPGTLNVRLGDGSQIQGLKRLRSMRGVELQSFTLNGETFCSVKCFDGELRGERVSLLLIEATHYNETVAELISPTYLRDRLGLEDGDDVSFTINVPDPTPSMQ